MRFGSLAQSSEMVFPFYGEFLGLTRTVPFDKMMGEP
jgi:hypothetical protein